MFLKTGSSLLFFYLGSWSFSLNDFIASPTHVVNWAHSKIPPGHSMTSDLGISPLSAALKRLAKTSGFLTKLPHLSTPFFSIRISAMKYGGLPFPPKKRSSQIVGKIGLMCPLLLSLVSRYRTLHLGPAASSFMNESIRSCWTLGNFTCATQQLACVGVHVPQKPTRPWWSSTHHQPGDQ